MMTCAIFGGGIGVPEVLIILVVVLLLFGAKRLPELSRSLGRSLSEFKKGKEEGARETLDKKPEDAPGDSDRGPDEPDKT